MLFRSAMDAGKRLALIRIAGPGFVAGFQIWLPSWPNDRKSRAQWWEAPQASIPTTVGASFSKNATISLRLSFLRKTTFSAAFTP